MKRRNLLQGVAAASAIPVTGIALGYEGRESLLPAFDEPVVVDGRVAAIIDEACLESMKKAGVHCAVTGAPRDFRSFSNLLDFFDAHGDDLVHARSVADIRRARREGRHSSVFSWQHTAVLSPEFSDLNGARGSALRGFQEIGLRIVGLCYDMSHAFGGGNLGPHIPLTRAGRRLVEEIHRLRMVLDLGGHTGERAALDAIAMAPDIPVICTGSTVSASARDTGRLSEALIDAIAGTGGVIGLSAVDDLPARERSNARAVDFETFANQCDYVRRRAGAAHVGIGSGLAEGTEQMPRLIAALRQRGWSQREIEIATGENWLRVYEKVWGA